MLHRLQEYIGVAIRPLLGVALTSWCLLWSSAAFSAVAGEVSGSGVIGNGSVESLVVPINKSRVLRLSAPASRVSIGNPAIADILIVRAGQLYVLGKSLGTTNVHLWDRSDNLIGTVGVEVSHDIESLKFRLHETLPNESIEVHSVQGSIMLQGSVSSVVSMQAALRMAEAYAAAVSGKKSGGVINMMSVSGGQQVMLEVKVAEIARTELKRLDPKWNWGDVGGNKWSWGGSSNGGALSGVSQTSFFNDLPFADKGFGASFLTSNTLFNIVLDAAKEKGLAKILAEPTLTTLTGQEATFLSGGEFPIPVLNGDDGITIQFKEFGVGLKFLPVVLSPDSINIKVNITVSELVNTNNVSVGGLGTNSVFSIPSLTKRSANVTVELSEGQTMGVAGLINQSLREAVTKFPGLGDLPILGSLFTSREFINNETELVILVTPHIAKPIAPQDIRLPTDKFVEPNDVEFYLMGRMEGRKPKAGFTSQSEGGAESNFGHQAE